MMFSRDIWHTFNPHEREARDLFLCRNIKTDSYFNPHEREARDSRPPRNSPSRENFNPHEREARDFSVLGTVYGAGILIHTSVKLVTENIFPAKFLPSHFNPHEREARDDLRQRVVGVGTDFNPHEREARDVFCGLGGIFCRILIHTSVKLVTHGRSDICTKPIILIHTSVKLVTPTQKSTSLARRNFNPHEREARDRRERSIRPQRRHFNPHEREARDFQFLLRDNITLILIHTSVKLVTGSSRALHPTFLILIHTSVKLVTTIHTIMARELTILIHTSVKLVTPTDSRKAAKSPILIHTSVKLVTSRLHTRGRLNIHFNPHEREARDFSMAFLVRTVVLF